MNVKSFDELYPNRFLKAGFVVDNPTYTISDVYVEELGEGDEAKQKGVLSFEETEMELTLNRTNGECIKRMFGKKLSDWIGKRVTFCSEQAQFGREKVDAVRVYGSPDISNDMNVSIKMPKRKPVVRQLKKVVLKKQGSEVKGITSDQRDKIVTLLDNPVITDTERYKGKEANYTFESANKMIKHLEKIIADRS